MSPIAPIDTGQSLWCLLNHVYPCYGQERAADPTAVAVQWLLIGTAIILTILILAHGVFSLHERYRGRRPPTSAEEFDREMERLVAQREAGQITDLEFEIQRALLLGHPLPPG